MCDFYAHTHRCGHTIIVFARACTKAALSNKRCFDSTRRIIADLQEDTKCDDCVEDDPPARSRNVKKGRKVSNL
jgi:hypothetical protein